MRRIRMVFASLPLCFLLGILLLGRPATADGNDDDQEVCSDKPVDPVNGVFGDSCAGANQDTTCYGTCNKDYTGSPTTKCKDDGTWDLIIGECTSVNETTTPPGPSGSGCTGCSGGSGPGIDTNSTDNSTGNSTDNSTLPSNSTGNSTDNSTLPSNSTGNSTDNSTTNSTDNSTGSGASGGFGCTFCSGNSGSGPFRISSTDGSTFSARRRLLVGAAPRMRYPLPPALDVDGRPANVAPFAVTGTNWKGRDTTDVAACLSGALVTLSNIKSIMSAEAPPEVAELHTEMLQEAKSIMTDVVPLFGERATFYTSSMYTRAQKLSAKQLKAELINHYDSLSQVPGCIELPTYMANTLYYTLQSFMSMAHGNAGLSTGPKGLAGEEAALEVTAVVQDVVQGRRPELCEGIKGSDIRFRFTSSLTSAARMPESLWVYTASDGVGCEVSST